MKKQVVLIADDFGLTKEVNGAIIQAHQSGALHGAGLMMGQAATQAAVVLAREHPSLEVGWHLHLVDSRPCSVPEWPWGCSPAGAGFSIGCSARMRDLVKREIERQWEAYLETGLPCRFVNAHHHLHVHPVVRRSLVETLPKDFDGWVRWGRPRFFGSSPWQGFYRLLDALLQAPHRRRFPFRMSTTLWGIDRTFNMRAHEILDVIPALGKGLHEFMFHPRRRGGDPDTRALLALRNRI